MFCYSCGMPLQVLPEIYKRLHGRVLCHECAGAGVRVERPVLGMDMLPLVLLAVVALALLALGLALVFAS